MEALLEEPVLTAQMFEIYEYSGKTYTHEEVFNPLIERLNAHYGTNYRLK